MSNYAFNVDDAADQAVAGRVGRKGVLIRSLTGSDTAYLSNDPGVTIANGFPLEAGETLALSREMGGVDPSAPIYAICAAAETAELRVWDLA